MALAAACCCERRSWGRFRRRIEIAVAVEGGVGYGGSRSVIARCCRPLAGVTKKVGWETRCALLGITGKGYDCRSEVTHWSHKDFDPELATVQKASSGRLTECLAVPESSCQCCLPLQPSRRLSVSWSALLFQLPPCSSMALCRVLGWTCVIAALNVEAGDYFWPDFRHHPSPS